MSIENETVETATEQKVETDLSSRLQAAAFGEATQPQEQQAAAAATDAPSTTEVKTTETTETQVVEPFYKSLGFENEEAVVNEIKTLREKKPDELKFENDESRLIHELLRTGDKEAKAKVKEYLQTQEKLESLSEATVDSDTAEELIKMSYKLKYKDLTQQQIDYKFNKQYGIPKEPIKGEFDDDTEFEQKHNEWKSQVEDIKMDRVIEAQLIKPDLLKAKSELSLPEINTNAQTQNAPTEEQVKAHKAAVESFVKTVDVSFNDFKGFSTNVKDKDVDFTVGYDLSDEEKTSVKTQLQNFAESGFDANELLAERWVIQNQDGTKSLNTPQMVKDLSRMLYGEQSEQKIAFKAANERMDLHLKKTKNIDLGNNTGTNQPISFPTQQLISENLQKAAFG